MSTSGRVTFHHSPISYCTRSRPFLFAFFQINVSERERQQRRLEKERKITLTVAVVVGVFILCWGPLNVLLIVYAACHSCVSPLTIEAVEVLALMNSACNPIIYSVLNKDFRKTFKRLLCCQCRRRFGPVDEGVSATNVSMFNRAPDNKSVKHER